MTALAEPYRVEHAVSAGRGQGLCCLL